MLKAFKPEECLWLALWLAAPATCESSQPKTSTVATWVEMLAAFDGATAGSLFFLSEKNIQRSLPRFRSLQPSADHCRPSLSGAGGRVFLAQLLRTEAVESFWLIKNH